MLMYDASKSLFAKLQFKPHSFRELLGGKSQILDDIFGLQLTDEGGGMARDHNIFTACH